MLQRTCLRGTAFCGEISKRAVTSGWRALTDVSTSLVIQLRKPPVGKPPVRHSLNFYLGLEVNIFEGSPSTVYYFRNQIRKRFESTLRANSDFLGFVRLEIPKPWKTMHFPSPERFQNCATPSKLLVPFLLLDGARSMARAGTEILTTGGTWEIL